MSKNTLVTTSQTESVRKMANEKKVSRVRFQKALDDGRISCFLDSLKEVEIMGYLKPISSSEPLTLDPTDGTETIAQATDLFTGYIDSDFRNWGCDVKSEPTKTTQVFVHEMIKDGTFAQIFNGMSDDLNSLCLTQSQIIQFVKKHRKWLRTDGYGTFFLFKVGEEFFVAYVSFYSGGRLEVRVARFSYGRVWYAALRRRIVVPQLTLKN